MEVPTIYKAYVSEYHHKIWPYMVQYLHFRINSMVIFQFVMWLFTRGYLDLPGFSLGFEATHWDPPIVAPSFSNLGPLFDPDRALQHGVQATTGYFNVWGKKCTSAERWHLQSTPFDWIQKRHSDNLGYPKNGRVHQKMRINQ